MRKPQKMDSKNFIRVIVLLARSHPGESVASFVCQGYLEFLLSSHPIATMLRENFVFKIIPMINPDGVFLGNNRCNLIGQDLNRAWNIATEFSHPTIVATKNLLKELDSSEVYNILWHTCTCHFNQLYIINSTRATKLISSWICTHIQPQMDHLFMVIHMKMCIVMKDTWFFQNYYQRRRQILLLKIWCSMPMREKVDQSDAFVRNWRIQWMVSILSSINIC